MANHESGAGRAGIGLGKPRARERRRAHSGTRTGTGALDEPAGRAVCLARARVGGLLSLPALPLFELSELGLAQRLELALLLLALRAVLGEFLWARAAELESAKAAREGCGHSPT